MNPFPTRASLTFRRQVTAFRDLIHQEVHPLQMLIFLEVINTPEYTVSQSYVRSVLGITQASASRHCRVLTSRVDPRKEGYGLCAWTFSETDFRTKYLVLTEKGKEVAEALREVFEK